MEEKPQIVVILGPTATGKSDLAVTIAKEFGGEVISADSRQVYKGMDIGTGKITKEETQGIPHHLIDIVSPTSNFSVSTYQRRAHKAIKDILKRDKLPIICGGTGFYIQAVVDNISYPEVKPNKELRKKLSQKSAEELFALLHKKDPQRAETIDARNPVRLIRAIEIAEVLGSVPVSKPQPLYSPLMIGLDFPDEMLKERIHIRLAKRMRAGMIAEVKKLHASGVSWKKLEAFGLEYRYAALFLQGKISKKDMLEKLESEIWQYAKRQRTWFKKDKRIEWLTTGQA